MGPARMSAMSHLMKVSTRTEVDGASTSLEQEQTVEHLEEQGVGLMNLPKSQRRIGCEAGRKASHRAEDGLTGSGELAKEANQIVGRLTVETGSRFVEEKQELRLRGELDADGETLASFDRETEAGETDHGLHEVSFALDGESDAHQRYPPSRAAV